FEDIQQRLAKNFDGPVRIKDVRIFNPGTQSLTEPVSVVVMRNRIHNILPVDSPSSPSEVEIDGEGGTLVAGFYEMHAHLGQNNALLNIAAGVNSVRDMGNNNEVLSELIGKIKSGRLAGPRVIRSGFIEGKSPFNSNNGMIVSSEEEAVAAVRSYTGGEFYQIKIYNSINPDWVPAMIAEAHANGLKVAGHVPAFSNADAMIAAGYDEMTHINQVMLGWVLEEGEDTRTLLRLTALKRLPSLEEDDPAIAATIDAMAANNVAIDPTLAIHENLLRSRNGTTAPGVVDYIDHMPVEVQRSAKTAWADISTPGNDRAYWQAFDKIIETVSAMRDKGIQLVPGTDLGGSFSYHRELELYQLAGMSAAEILKWATYDMAAYVGQQDELGSIEVGKLADFFLIPGDPTVDLKAIKTISLVVKDGTFYFPSEIYPEFGIRPFVAAPLVTQLATQ
ncbi:MAG: amidohydrolase family protein, partial [Lysobacterales bacterium]